MPTPSQIAISSITASTKYTDEKILELQKQIDELKERLRKLEPPPSQKEPTIKDTIVVTR